ncbi:hypothetical protein BDW71DRAFT_172716 [Aspergillus fruticulosus]
MWPTYMNLGMPRSGAIEKTQSTLAWTKVVSKRLLIPFTLTSTQLAGLRPSSSADL